MVNPSYWVLYNVLSDHGREISSNSKSLGAQKGLKLLKIPSFGNEQFLSGMILVSSHWLAWEINGV